MEAFPWLEQADAIAVDNCAEQRPATMPWLSTQTAWWRGHARRTPERATRTRASRPYPIESGSSWLGRRGSSWTRSPGLRLTPLDRAALATDASVARHFNAPVSRRSHGSGSA